MLFVYIIEVLTARTWHTGIVLDPINRLKEHNTGKNRVIKSLRPWKIIYTKKYPDWLVTSENEK